MSTPNRAIGGYLELDAGRSSRHDFLHSDGLLLNTGRACFEYVLRCRRPSLVYMPKFTCQVMFEPLAALGIPYELYTLTERFEPQLEIDDGSDTLILYTNYFGLTCSTCKALASRYGSKVVIDNAQGYYSDPLPDIATFYSPRKFFGLPDGGILYSNHRVDIELQFDVSYGRFMPMVKRIDLGPEPGYEEFKASDANLSGEPIKRMSRLTRHLLEVVDFEAARLAREENFTFLHERLGDRNNLAIELGRAVGPMCYPFLTDDADLRQKLIDKRVYVPTFWPDLPSKFPHTFEAFLARSLIPIPVDQRYGHEEMQLIVRLINQ